MRTPLPALLRDTDQSALIAQARRTPPAAAGPCSAWSHGGETNRDGWICPPRPPPRHDPNYDHEKLPNGKIRFHRRM